MMRLSKGPGVLVGLGFVTAAAAMAAGAAAPPPPMGHSHMEVAPAAKKLHAELERVTRAAARQGNYTCCIAPPCGFCAVHMAHCPCGKNLAARKPVCRECKGGWEVGEGRIAGVRAAAVKGMSTREAMKMHEMHHPGPGEKAGHGR